MTRAALLFWRHRHRAPPREGAGRPCRGWTQARAARYLGVATQTYLRWERGTRPIPVATARLIRSELNHRSGT